MGYLLAQIFLCLLVAAILGGLIGWLLRARGADALADGSADLGAARARAAALEADLADARARAATLESDLADCRASAAHAAALHADAAPAAVPGAGAVVPRALFGEPADAPEDDLKRISGVGPVIERQLAGIGVTTFRQIARFSPEDVARVNDAIEVFQGRIEREEWIAQAARLHRADYGTEP